MNARYPGAFRSPFLQLVTLRLALGLSALLPIQIGYEEMLLQDTFGEMSRDYCAHGGRYVRFR